jgi:glycerate 2-kinase
MDVLSLYFASLAACDPERLMREYRAQGAGGGAQVFPRNVVAIGKSAGPLLDGFGDYDNAFVAMPEGYREPRAKNARVYRGGHPDMTAASFAAGRALLDFVDAHDDITFLVSGGGSACVEVPLPPHTEAELIARNRELVASGLPIGEINRVRRTLSAIKGGRLGGRVRGRCVTLVYSDVSSGRLEDVASGPSLIDMRLIADNTTLVRAAARLAGAGAFVVDEQIENDVEEAARFLASIDAPLVIAGGEPTVVVRGGGKGGRCSELAVRFATAVTPSVSEGPGCVGGAIVAPPARPGPSLTLGVTMTALFASSDGVDGNSGVAGWLLRLPRPFDRAAADTELSRSNSAAAAARIGEAIMIPSAGNNLRDLYILARG